MFSKTILRTPIRGGTQHAMSFTTRIVDRCVQWLQPRGQVAPWASAMAEVRPARISAPSYRLKRDELIIQNTRHVKKLVQCSRVSCTTCVLMSRGVAELCERTLGKLLNKLQQADLPNTQLLADLLTCRPATTSRKAKLYTSSTASRGAPRRKWTTIALSSTSTAPPLRRPPRQTLFSRRTIASSTCWRRASGRRPSARSLATGEPSFSSRRRPKRRYTSTRPSTTSAN